MMVRLTDSVIDVQAVRAAICSEISERWPGARVAMVHRVGVVAVGEASVVIGVSAPHRDEAYAASRHAIDTLKASVPIWKKEIYADGSVWKANAEPIVHSGSEESDLTSTHCPI